MPVMQQGAYFVDHVWMLNIFFACGGHRGEGSNTLALATAPGALGVALAGTVKSMSSERALKMSHA